MKLGSIPNTTRWGWNRTPMRRVCGCVVGGGGWWRQSIKDKGVIVVQLLICVQLHHLMECSTPGFPVLHYLPEFAQTHVHWVDDAIHPSHPVSPPSPPGFNPSQHQGLFRCVGSSHQVATVLNFQHPSSNEYSRLISFRMDWLNLFAVQGTLKSLLQHHDSKASILWCSTFFMVQLSHPYMTTGKTIALTRWTFVRKVMSLLFNMLSRFVIAFLPRSKCLLISLLQPLSSVILKPRKIKSVTASIFSPSIFHEVMGPDDMIFVFWMLSFKPVFSLSSLVPLHFLPLGWYHLHIWGYWYFSWQC